MGSPPGKVSVHDSQGRNRDTAWYSIIDAEWPALKRVYEEWLDPANFDNAGQQRRRLEEIRASLD